MVVRQLKSLRTPVVAQNSRLVVVGTNNRTLPEIVNTDRLSDSGWVLL